MKLVFILIVTLLTGVKSLYAQQFDSCAQQRFTVCTMTLNSSDEREIFQKKLRAEERASGGSIKYDFVELTDFGRGEPDWFGQACDAMAAKRKKCDILIVSGHFAEYWFGKKVGGNLSLHTMEKASCRRSCDAILKPRFEAHLYGCNTASSVVNDGRPAHEYFKKLAGEEYNYSTRGADAITQMLYFKWGKFVKDRMQEVFYETPRIYGFAGVSGTGAQNRRPLNNYFQAIKKEHGTYAAHLQKLCRNTLKQASLAGQYGGHENARQALPQEKYDWLLNNQQLLDSFRGTKFRQLSGVMPYDHEMQQQREDKCRLYDGTLSTSEKMAHVRSLFRNPKFKRYLPMLSRFFKEDRRVRRRFIESSTYEDLQAARVQIDELMLETNPSGFVRKQVLDFARQVDLLDSDQEFRHQKNVAHNLLEYPYVESQAEKEICRAVERYPNIFDDFDTRRLHGNLLSIYKLKALQCIARANPGFVDKNVQREVSRYYHINRKKQGYASLADRAGRFLRRNRLAVLDQHEVDLEAQPTAYEDHAREERRREQFRDEHCSDCDQPASTSAPEPGLSDQITGFFRDVTGSLFESGKKDRHRASDLIAGISSRDRRMPQKTKRRLMHGNYLTARQQMELAYIFAEANDRRSRALKNDIIDIFNRLIDIDDSRVNERAYRLLEKHN